jgi:rfaE bifunctional protein nucleotidyltransferase chain/domain
MVRPTSYYQKRLKVFTNGCFDLFHAGHLKILKEAKKLGTELHVGINSNFSVAILKGLNRPIISEEYRLEIVKAIKYVDRVYLFDEPTPIKLIEQIKPDIIVKGGDYNKEDVVGSNLAEVIIVPLMKNVSTSNIINRIINENV